MTLYLLVLLIMACTSQVHAEEGGVKTNQNQLFLDYISSFVLTYCSSLSYDDCIVDGVRSGVGFLCIVYTTIITSSLIVRSQKRTITRSQRRIVMSQQRMGQKNNFKSTSSENSLCRILIVLSTCCVIESTVIYHFDLSLFMPQCKCEDSVLQYAFCQLMTSLLIVTTISVLGCFAWSTDFFHGFTFIILMAVWHSVSNVLTLFFITPTQTCISTSQRVTEIFVMYIANLLGILFAYKSRDYMQGGGGGGSKITVDAADRSHQGNTLDNSSSDEDSSSSMNTDNQSKQRHDISKLKLKEEEDFEDESQRYNKEKAFQFSPKYRWSRKKHPLSSRFGTDSFLPCVVLMKKKGRASPPVTVNVTNIGLSATTKHHPPRHTHRRASLGVIKERGGGGEEATWARLSQRRRTSLPTTFHSSRKQTVMSSVLIETSVIAELHSTLNELSVATSASNSDVEVCASRMQRLLKPYKNENLCPSQVVWLHDSISSTSDGSDDEENVRGNRANFNKRVVSRRPEWSNNDGGVWTTTTSATGLPSHEPGPVKSKRLPKIQKTPSNTPHDSRCSSPISGKDVGSLSRRRTIHNIGPLNSPGRPQTFFGQEESGNIGDGKDGRRSNSFSLFTSSDYESCDNLLTDGSEGETVKQMPDLQQPSSAGRRGTIEGSSHDSEQSPKIRMLITEPTIDEDSEEDEKQGGSSGPSSGDETDSCHKSSDCESYQEDLTQDGVSPEELQRIFNNDDYKAELLEKVYSWNFPIFELADGTHCVLSQMAYKLFDDTGLFTTFRIPRKPFVDYMRALENGYRNIPYHNRIHASDVLHGCWFLTTQQIPGFSETSPLFSSDSSDSDSGTAHTQVNTVGNGSLAQAIPALELMALYLAAAMHDYDHPGRTNAFLVETRHPLAMLYNDRSVLENHHASASWELLHSKTSYDFLVNLDVAEWKRLRFLIVEAILATDLKKHFELMSRFSSKISRRNDASSEATDTLRHEGYLKWTADEDRLLVCQMVIKLADIGGPTKVRDLHVTWTRAICQEFFTQGDEERQLNSPVSPFMDRERPQVAQLQRTFIKNLIAPLVCKMHRAGILAGYAEDSEEKGEEDNILEPTEDGTTINCRSLIREQLADNLRYWHDILQQEMDGQVEMEKVFKCCHKVTLEHEKYSPVDSDFAKNLLENRREKLHQNNATTTTKTASKSSKKDSSNEAKERHKNETFPKINFPPPRNQTELKATPRALCNINDKNKSKLPTVYRKIP